MEAGERSSWEALEPGTPVLSSDGQQIGTVKEVIAAAEHDIFDHAVELKIDAAAAAQLQPPTPAPAAMEVGVDDVSEKSGPYKREIFFKKWWNRLSGKY